MLETEKRGEFCQIIELALKSGNEDYIRTLVLMKDRVNLSVFMTENLRKQLTILAKQPAKYLNFVTECLIPVIIDERVRTRFHDQMVR